MMSAPQVIKNLDKIHHPVFADVIRKYCEILLQHFGERLMGVLLYGSIARGDWDRDSDIDVLVVVRGWEEKHGWDRTVELVALENRLAETEEYKRAVERGYWPVFSEYPLGAEEARRSQRVYIDACVDGIILFERERFLSRIMGQFREKLKRLGARRVYLRNGRYYWILWRGRAGGIFEL